MDTSEKKHSSTPESNKSGRQIKDHVKNDAAAVKQAATDKIKKATEKAKSKADDATTDAGKKVENLADTIDAVAATLSDKDKDGLANYAHQMSSSMNKMADRLKNSSIDELADDVKKMARENPSEFVLASVALGFGLSRFGKASASREDSTNHNTSSHPGSKEASVSSENDYGVTSDSIQDVKSVSTHGTNAFTTGHKI